MGSSNTLGWKFLRVTIKVILFVMRNNYFSLWCQGYIRSKSLMMFWFWAFSNTGDLHLELQKFPCTKYCKNHNGSGSYFVSKGKFSLKKELITSVSDSKLPPGCIAMRSKRHARSELKAHLAFLNMHSDKLDKSVDTHIYCCIQYPTLFFTQNLPLNTLHFQKKNAKCSSGTNNIRMWRSFFSTTNEK